MANYQIALHLANKIVTVQNKGDALPTGAKKIGEFEHADVENNINDLDFDVNHVFYHHVQDALYHTSNVTGERVTNGMAHPNNIIDLADYQINYDIDYIKLTGIAITPAGTSTLTVAAPTVQLDITATPSGASNKKVTYVSSAPNIATVNANGLVTRVANGLAVITATSEDGGLGATKNITCTA